MTRSFHLWPEEQRRLGDDVEVAAVLEGPRRKRTRLYFRLPAEEIPSLTRLTDPFILLTTFHLMASGTNLQVHGSVSLSLLRGLEEFQAAWSRWRPDRYRPYSVEADAEVEDARQDPGRNVMTFSGGLDSCFSAWRHTRGGSGRRKRGLDAAVMVHGFDIPRQQDQVFGRALESSGAILDSIDTRLIPVVCNVRDLKDDWEDLHGAALAACLHLLAGGFSTGLIAGSNSYDDLRIPWGSNPITDPLLAGESFSIVHDGCELTRWEKAGEIGDWEEAMLHLRVCWAGKHLDRNCGSCIRCVGTAVCFAVVARPIPPSIPIHSPGDAVDRLRSLNPSSVQLGQLMNMANSARKIGLKEAWVSDLERFVEQRSGFGRRRRFGFPRQA